MSKTFMLWLSCMIFVLVKNAAVSSARKRSADCPPNEEMQPCGPICEPSCRRPQPMSCMEECVMEGCTCKDGFFRNSDGNCVSDCSSEPCDQHAVRKACAATEGCETLCIPVHPLLALPCENKCVVNGCECQAGFVRLSPGGPCISDEECRAESMLSGANELVHIAPCGYNVVIWTSSLLGSKF